MLTQNPADRFPAEPFQPLVRPKVLLQLGQRPRGEAQPQVRRPAGCGLDDPRLNFGAIIARTARTRAPADAAQPFGLEAPNPKVRVGVMQTGHLGSSAQIESGCQVPEQSTSPEDSRRGLLGAQQPLDLDQLVGGQQT